MNNTTNENEAQNLGIPSSESQKTDSLKAELACTECPHIFTEAELAAENKSAWGHPCHANVSNPPTACESFRKPPEEETEGERVLRRRRAFMTDYDERLERWLS